MIPVQSICKLAAIVKLRGAAIRSGGDSEPFLKGVVEGAGLGESESVSCLNGRDIGTRKKESRNVLASPLEEFSVRRTFQTQSSLQGAAAHA